jgi:hypothetical protein
VATEPVNEIASTPGWATSADPISDPRPATTLRTPGGSPASSSACTSGRAVRVAASAGLSTTVLPKTSAGASFHVGIAAGKFHGVTSPTTPTGRRRVNSQVAGVLAS